MAQLTRDQIVSEGQLLAGRDDNATASAAWLQRWLDSVAASWPWPLLQDELTGVVLATGASSLNFGQSTGESAKVLKILDNIWLYDSTRTFRRRLRVRHQLNSPSDRIGPPTNIGTPATVRVFQRRSPTVAGAQGFGHWTLYFEPIPEREYLLSIPYIFLPEPMTAGTDVPWYPNDETMVQAVAFKNHEFYDGKDSPVTQAAQAALAGLVANDRIRYGATTGVNDFMMLDPSVFNPRR